MQDEHAAGMGAPPGGMAATMVVRLGYRGAGFAGFAEQPGQRTVAGELRTALETLLHRPVDLTCAGRTDAGVNALAQYVSLPVTRGELEREGRRLVSSLVALTPDDLSVRGLYKADVSFSARFDALERGYRYRVACGSARPVLSWGHTWWLRSVADLDVDAMGEAASALLGEHDFRSFCKASSAGLLEADGRSTCRRLSAVSVVRAREAGEELVAIDVRGNAFLHNMVRVIAGTLVEVGRGHRDASWVARALAAHDRSAAGPTAPAHGLTFEWVGYPEAALVSWE
ncbi:tRNA pseudouridine synthase A [Olsenella uli DSM 7084]|uniref:tRNA pseudouridine synthase A n=1 Tax=Olsenella uli (strain ATCC 49627 / DSM 7084 / CCUG 31166 / CIP 109912 / JCM 12494 / LMG 11480 / NCIMB 702895 / VPI D76D-27C) TaxID=633147 RepID=E1QX23_OLSUV|nr:tRNA pseudouridine(38-40) synthase TruA [Olsenella uli]ADK68676.1 tRNA pseudouridine synthase A [Olsenella uli DSM 7084]KRO12152.1 tRNA pseudouridine synthase A [Olsenella uli DSM 7084]